MTSFTAEGLTVYGYRIIRTCFPAVVAFYVSRNFYTIQFIPLLKSLNAKGTKSSKFAAPLLSKIIAIIIRKHEQLCIYLTKLTIYKDIIVVYLKCNFTQFFTSNQFYIALFSSLSNLFQHNYLHLLYCSTKFKRKPGISRNYLNLLQIRLVWPGCYGAEISSIFCAINPLSFSTRSNSKIRSRLGR